MVFFIKSFTVQGDHERCVKLAQMEVAKWARRGVHLTIIVKGKKS